MISNRVGFVASIALLLLLTGGLPACNSDRAFDSPELRADAQWEATGWPPSGGEVVQAQNRSTYLGTVGRFSLVSGMNPYELYDRDIHISAVPDEGWGAEIAENLAEIGSDDASPRRILEFADALYVTTPNATYRCEENCGSPEEVAPGFVRMRVKDDALYGMTRSGDKKAWSTGTGRLVVHETGDAPGAWREVADDIEKFNFCADTLFVARELGDVEYSTDGGESWESDASRADASLFGEHRLVEHKGTYWGGSWASPGVASSTDCRQWEDEIPADPVAYRRGFVNVAGDLLAIEAHDLGEGDRYDYLTRIVRRSDGEWETVAAPEGFEILELHPVGDELRVLTAGAGLYRLEVGGDWSFEPIGPALGSPSDIARTRGRMAVATSLPSRGELKVGEVDWGWRHVPFRGAQSNSVWSVDGGFVVARNPGEERGFSLHRVGLDGSEEALTDFQEGAANPNWVEEVFERDGEVLVLMGGEGLFRVDRRDGGLEALGEVGGLAAEEVDGFFEDVTVHDGWIWLLYATDRRFAVYRSRAGAEWEMVSGGLPGEGRQKLVRLADEMSFATTQAAVYLHAAPVTEEGERQDGLYRWREGGSRWKEVAGPPAAMLEDDVIREVHGTSGGVYAASRESVLQFDPVKSRWADLTANLPAESNPRSLLATDERLWIGVADRGVWTYPAKSWFQNTPARLQSHLAR